MKVHLRYAEPHDIDAVCELEQASFAQPWTRASYLEVLKNGRAVFLVAERETADGGRELLSQGVAVVIEDECEVCTLAVKEKARRHGIGARVLMTLLSECARRGAKQSFLEVRPSNEAAHTLYKRVGFEEMGRRRGYYADGEDAILMHCNLPLATPENTQGQHAAPR